METKLYSNVVEDKKLKDILAKTLSKLSKTISNTLGPNGSTTIIREDTGMLITKDGFEILKRLVFNDVVAQSLYQIILNISEGMVTSVGDGSSSCIVAANELFIRLNTCPILKELRTQEIIDKFNKIVEVIIECIKISKRTIDDNNLEITRNIARVSLNHNTEIADVIGDIYKEVGKDGFINIELSQNAKTTYTKVDGFQLNKGYCDPIFRNSENECCLNDTAILIINSSFNSDTLKSLMKRIMDMYINIISKKPGYEKFKSMLIISPGYDLESLTKVRQTITDFQDKYNLKNNLCLIIQPMSTQLDVHFVEDIAAITSANLILTSMGDVEAINKGERDLIQYAGYSERVIVGEKLTTFKNSQYDKEKVKNLIEYIKNERDKLSPNKVIKKYEMQKRLAILNSNLVTIKVGGNTEVEKATNKTLVEDAVAACKSAINHGYGIGGNLMIPISILDYLKEHENEIDKYDKVIYDILSQSFIAVYSKILRNAEYSEDKISKIIQHSVSNKCIFDIVSNEYTDDKIINSIETEEQILRNVVSIITLLVTSNQFISINATEDL